MGAEHVRSSGSPFLGPWLEERILVDDEDVLVVDKPSGLPVHGDDERLRTDIVRRLADRASALGRDPYLGVHQRLDVGTSGVLLFVRRRSVNPGVAQDFAKGLVEKRYVAAVEIRAGSPLASRSELELTHRIAPDRGRMRVVQRDGKLCRTGCRVLSRRGNRALVALAPETGRTHQLRVQLAAVGAAIGGDVDYGGAPSPRLLLHAESLAVPSLRRRFTSTRPALFSRFLSGDVEALGENSEVRQKLRDAGCRRYPLLSETQAFRWVNAWADELPGVVVDYYAGHAVLALSRDEAVERRQELAELLTELGAESVYLKLRLRADLRRVAREEIAPSRPLVGVGHVAPLVVKEGAFKVSVALGDGLSTGLFVDQRGNHQRLFSESAGCRVLNLFAYTGAFSVAAALGGAQHVTSVDISRRALERARDNFRLNGLDPDLHTFEQGDVVRFLERAQRKNVRFDWIVLDPPSFSSAAGSGVLKIERDYARLAALALALLAPGGRLLAVTNHLGTSRAALRRMLLESARSLGLSVRQAKELPSGYDCPDGRDGPEPSRAVLLSLS